MTLEEFNTIDKKDLVKLLNGCCTSSSWQSEVARLRPFKTLEDLYSIQEKAFMSLGREDFLEAFDGHPKIGDVSSLKEKYAHTKELAAGEQSGVDEASEQVISELSNLNTEYLNKFGYIFIVCATGKSALEMLNLLKERIENKAEDELLIAAIEQAKITKIRLEKLL